MTIKRSLQVAFLTALTATAAAAQQAAPAAGAGAHAAAAPYTAKAKLLSRAELDALLNQPTPALLIDVRRPDEVSTIGGFPVYLSIQIGQLEQYWNQIPKNRQIVVVSNHAGRGGKAADLLTAKGLNVVGAVGAQLYEQEGGTLVKRKPAAATTAAHAGAAQ